MFSKRNNFKKLKHLLIVQMEPDLDHIVPIAYALGQERPKSVLILCVNILFDVRHDYRITYLKEEHGIETKYIGEFLNVCTLRYRIARWFLWLPRIFLSRLNIWGKLYWRILPVRWGTADYLLKTLHPKTVSIDEALPGPSREAFFEASRRYDIKVIDIPTGCRIQKFHTEVPYKLDDKDFMVVPHKLITLPNSDDPRVVELGSARYCSEWQKVNELMLTKKYGTPEIRKDNGTIRVLILGRSNCGFNGDHSLVQSLEGLDKVEVVFKDKPRGVWPHKVYARDVNAYPTAYWIRWSDVVIFSVTATVFEALYRKKIALYAKYISPDDMTTTENDENVMVMNSEEEIIDVIKMAVNGGMILTGETNKMSQLFLESVSLGSEDNDILHKHFEFYESII